MQLPIVSGHADTVLSILQGTWRVRENERELLVVAEFFHGRFK